MFNIAKYYTFAIQMLRSLQYVIMTLIAYHLKDEKFFDVLLELDIQK